MEKCRLNKILSLAESFEFQALAAKNDRVWAIQSLISLGDAQLSEFFIKDLGLLLGQNISPEEFDEWIKKNPAFQNYLDKEWLITSDKYSSFLEATDPASSNEHEYVYIRIYKSSLPVEAKEVLKLKESSLLQGTSTIPTLYFYKVVPLQENVGLSTLDKQYHSYMFLAEALSQLFGTIMDNEFKNKFSEFVDKNKDRLSSLFQYMKKAPKFLDKGQDGAVFDLGSNYILKIFKDKKSYQDALSSMHRLHKNPELAKTEAMIYDVGDLGVFDNKQIFFYIIEKMTPARSLPKEILNPLIHIVSDIIKNINFQKDYWRPLKDIMHEREQIGMIKQKVTEGAAAISSSIENSLGKEITAINQNLNLRNDWLPSLVEEILMKYLTNRTDLHMGNLGLTNYGNFRYFDPGYSGLTSEFNYDKYVDQEGVTKEQESGH